MTAEKPIDIQDIQTTVARNEEIIFSDTGDEMVMMSVEKSEYYGLNPVGRRIWEILDSPCKISMICQCLCEEFDVTPDRCYRDVSEYLSRMAGLGLIQVASNES